MAMQGWPEKLYVVSKEKEEIRGVYHRMAGKEHNSHPIWKHETSDVFIFWSLTQQKTFEWGFATVESQIAENAATLRCVCPATSRGKSSSFPCRYVIDIVDSELLFGTVVSAIKPKQFLDEWSRVFWQLSKRLPSVVYVNQREEIEDHLEELRSYLAEHLFKVHQENKRLSRELTTCTEGCVAALRPDVELKVGSDCIPASGKILMAKSPVFEAMLRDGCPMKEAVSGRVELPNANPEAVRALLCLLHTDGLCLDSLDLSQDNLLNVLSQAAEWQCTLLVDALSKNVRPKIKEASHSIALGFLRVASVQAFSTKSKNWEKLFALAAERVAETCSGDLDSLVPLSFATLIEVLACDGLDTKGKEGCVLQLVAQWAQTHGTTKLPQLLEFVRFPLMRLTSLDPDEKEAMRYVSEHAGSELRVLVGEAAMVQTGRKRPREDADDSETNILYKKRAQKRNCNGNIPTLNEKELGVVICGGLW